MEGSPDLFTHLLGSMCMTCLLRIAVAGSILCLLLGCASSAQEGALDLAYKAMQKGKYDLALKRLSRAERHKPPSASMVAEISFLRAECYERAGRIPTAVRAYAYTLEKYPGTIYGHQAREKLNSVRPGIEAGAAPNADPSHHSD
jgi:tetratricopeptide (TPR) repeat protein